MTTSHAKEVPTHRRICANGMACLTYIDTRTQIGFAWTGKEEDPIEVTHGGLGEPITNLIEHTVVGKRPLKPPMPHELMPYFERVCQEWLVRIMSGKEEPRIVREVW